MSPEAPADRLAFDEPGDVLARPHGNCYWLLAGRIIAGEYPRNIDDATSRTKLRSILAVGVTQFVDLTHPHELEPYAGLMQAEAARHGIAARHERHPIRDMGVPRASGMRAILDAIAANRDGVTYVHCWGGVGRTGTVVGCHLVRHGLTGPEALDLIARLRRPIRGGRRASPETDAQRALVLAWGREA